MNKQHMGFYNFACSLFTATKELGYTKDSDEFKVWLNDVDKDKDNYTRDLSELLLFLGMPDKRGKEPKKYGKFQQFKNFSWCKYDINLGNCLNVFYDIVNYLPGKDVQQYFDLNILDFDESQKKEIMKEIMFISEGRLWHKKWKSKNNPERNVFGKAFYMMPLEGRRRYYWPPTNELVTLMKISKYSGVEYTLLKYRVEKRGQHHLLSLEIPNKEEKNEI